MKNFKKLTSLILALLMVCTSFAWNGLEVQAETELEYETYEVASGDSYKIASGQTATYENTLACLTGTAEVYSPNSNLKTNRTGFLLNNNSSNYIFVPVETDWTSLEISFIANAGDIGGAVGIATADGTRTHVWSGVGTSEKITVELEKSATDDYLWTSHYTDDDGATWKTLNGTETLDEVVVSDGGYIYFTRDHSKNTFSLKEFTVTATQPAVYAKIGDSVYSSLDAALEGAVDTDTIVLQKAVTVADTYITKDIAIDLNGNTLTANSLVTFDADVIDSSEGKTGLLVCDKLMIPNNSQMPVYDSTVGGYRFAAVTIEDKAVTNPTGASIEFKTRPDFGADSIHTLVAGGSDASRLNVGIRIEWEGTDGTLYVQDCYLTDTFLSTMYSDAANPYGATFTLTGTDNFKNITATTFVTSLLGVEKLGTAHAPVVE